MLDFPHAGEHINNLLEVLESANIHFPPQMLSRSLHILKHRGPRPLLRMADRLSDALAERKGVSTHLEYLRKREALMQYPQFQRDGWPIGSGMVESANKNVVEARLKGTGMHWQRKNVNPMLALRNAVCNDRWKEMWQKALKHYRKLRALQKSARNEQRAPAPIGVGNASSQLPPASEPLPAPALTARPAESPTVTPSPSVPEALRSSSTLPSSRRKKHRLANRVKYAHAQSGEVDREICPCGTPLVRQKGHRPRQYCSDRCRQRAHRERQAEIA